VNEFGGGLEQWLGLHAAIILAAYPESTRPTPPP